MSVKKLFIVMGSYFVVQFGIDFLMVNEHNKHWAKHKEDVCTVTRINDTTITLLDNRNYDKFFDFVGAKPKTIADTFLISQNKADATGYISGKKSYAELTDDNTKAITHIYCPYGHYLQPDTINIALK